MTTITTLYIKYYILEIRNGGRGVMLKWHFYPMIAGERVKVALHHDDYSIWFSIKPEEERR